MSQNQQNENYCPEWLQTTLREAAIRRTLILDGNVHDIFYDPQQREYISLPELLVRMFGRSEMLNFSITGVWDQADGLRFGDSRIRERFQNALGGTTVQANSCSNNRSYDMGSQTPKTASSGRLYPEPTELLPAVRRAIDNENEHPAFILDYSQYMVTQPNHPDPNERNWMLQLKKAITDAGIISMNSDTLRQNKGLVVLLTTNLGKIPPLLYQADPRIKLISVPTPSRLERKGFFVRHTDDLRCERPKSSCQAQPSTTAMVGREELVDILADSTDQFQMVDLKHLVSLSLITKSPLLPEKLLNLYRFGDQSSPWEELSEDKLRNVDEMLRQRVIGQDEAVEYASTMMIRAYLGLAGLQHSGKRSKPKGSLFFVGPTGVGKTELAKAVAEFLFGDESAFIRFDMSEYNHEHSDQRLIGAPPGYIGFEQGGQLTNAVRKKPFSVILFDEIEKAHGRILDKFLQILEDGRLTDSKGETVHFSECVIIFTSNIGASTMPDTDDSEEIKRHFLAAVEDHFINTLNRPEILNRLGDNIVSFNKITDNSFRRTILKKKLSPLETHLSERFGVAIEVSENAHDNFLSGAKTKDGGRGLLNSLERLLINPLSRFIFDHLHQLRRGRTIFVSVEEDNIHFELQEGSNNE